MRGLTAVAVGVALFGGTAIADAIGHAEGSESDALSPVGPPTPVAHDGEAPRAVSWGAGPAATDADSEGDDDDLREAEAVLRELARSRGPRRGSRRNELRALLRELNGDGAERVSEADLRSLSPEVLVLVKQVLSTRGGGDRAPAALAATAGSGPSGVSVSVGVASSSSSSAVSTAPAAKASPEPARKERTKGDASIVVFGGAGGAGGSALAKSGGAVEPMTAGPMAGPRAALARVLSALKRKIGLDEDAPEDAVAPPEASPGSIPAVVHWPGSKRFIAVTAADVSDGDVPSWLAAALLGALLLGAFRFRERLRARLAKGLVRVAKRVAPESMRRRSAARSGAGRSQAGRARVVSSQLAETIVAPRRR